MINPIKGLDAYQRMTRHLKGCKQPDCDACVIAAELKRSRKELAGWKERTEESARRWNLLDAHEQLKAADHIKWETGISFMERCVLRELERQGESYPWQLANVAEEPINKQGVYTMLNRLEDKGMVSSRRLRNPDAVRFPYTRRHYRITESGQRALKAWDAAVAAVG